MSFGDDSGEMERVDENLQSNDGRNSSGSEDERMEITQVVEGSMNIVMDTNVGKIASNITDEDIKEGEIQDISVIEKGIKLDQNETLEFSGFRGNLEMRMELEDNVEIGEENVLNESDFMNSTGYNLGLPSNEDSIMFNTSNTSTDTIVEINTTYVKDEIEIGDSDVEERERHTSESNQDYEEDSGTNDEIEKDRIRELKDARDREREDRENKWKDDEINNTGACPKSIKKIKLRGREVTRTGVQKKVEKAKQKKIDDKRGRGGMGVQ